MILLPRHKNEEKEVIAHQLIGWVFESHLWKPDGKDLLPMTCQWCGLKTDIDIPDTIKRGEFVGLCPKNVQVLKMIGLDHVEEDNNTKLSESQEDGITTD